MTMFAAALSEERGAIEPGQGKQWRVLEDSCASSGWQLPKCSPFPSPLCDHPAPSLPKGAAICGTPYDRANRKEYASAGQQKAGLLMGPCHPCFLRKSGLRRAVACGRERMFHVQLGPKGCRVPFPVSPQRNTWGLPKGIHWVPGCVSS